METPRQVHGLLAPPDPLPTLLLRALGRLLDGINGSLVPQCPAVLDKDGPRRSLKGEGVYSPPPSQAVMVHTPQEWQQP